MNCTICGTKNPPDRTTCISCGHPLPRSKHEEASNNATSKAANRNSPSSNSAENEKASAQKSSKALHTGLAFVGLFLMAALTVFRNVENSSVKIIYFILIAVASVIIPLVQLIVQRRLMSEEYPVTLDRIHDQLAPDLRNILDPSEELIKETYAHTAKGPVLLALTGSRLIWVDSKKAGGKLSPRCIYALNLDRISKIDYNKLTGKLSIQMLPKGKINFKVSAVQANKRFYSFLFMNAVSATDSARQFESNATRQPPVYSLCMKCGDPTEKKEIFCRLHQQPQK